MVYKLANLYERVKNTFFDFDLIQKNIFQSNIEISYNPIEISGNQKIYSIIIKDKDIDLTAEYTEGIDYYDVTTDYILYKKEIINPNPEDIYIGYLVKDDAEDNNPLPLVQHDSIDIIYDGSHCIDNYECVYLINNLACTYDGDNQQYIILS